MWVIYNPPKNFCGFSWNKTDLVIRNRAMDISQLFHERALDMRWQIANVGYNQSYPTSANGIIVLLNSQPSDLLNFVYV